ncbi:efflux RND transporter permease subunit [Gimesia sp.]|uniref:efflux RND transporter permease subunit n=1 Tax=Gimesia sp. TaxID=2024833 RepID=UPI000C3F356F|nr:efflux RND transporter permease subunit [Gimesia sp.]MAX40041.1 acriflavin resistance protein [Gimesia sp.]
MQLIQSALRHPITVMIVVSGIVLGSFSAIGKPIAQGLGLPWPDALPQGMEVDIFPALNLPVIYVCQPYGGMDPAQMEGYLTNYYEYHFLYISGIHHVESRNIAGVALMKLTFHPGTDMSQAMAETINYVNRSQAFMPPGTVSPFVMRFDTGSVPVGRLVLSSETRTIAEIQDLALFQVRPMFASLPGVSAPPPFGGSQRTIVVSVNPEQLQSYGMSPDEVATALAQNNRISPSGNLPVGDKYPLVPVNSVVKDISELRNVPIRMSAAQSVYLRDVASVADFMDAPNGYALVNGRRAVYILATKRADASTLSVVNEIKKALPRMQAVLPDDIQVSFEFDQTPYVTRGVSGVAMEGAIGSILVGLLILVFLRDWRSSLVVVLNIPLALLVSTFVLWLTGNTLNLMTLGGLALAIGVLVDEATVAVENIHTRLEQGASLPRAVREGTGETIVPRFLAMVCILAVFVSSFFLQGAARSLFVPVALAVGFAMVTSYILSSTFVPVLLTWLLRNHPEAGRSHAPVLDRVRAAYRKTLSLVLPARWVLVAVYLVACGVIIVGVGTRLGTDIFPRVASDQFRIRMRAPDGTHLGVSEQKAINLVKAVEEEFDRDKIDVTLGYVGTVPSSYPINAVFHWSRGPEETVLWVDLKDDAEIDVAAVQERLRERLTSDPKFAETRFSFEASDIVNEVMSFGSPTPVEIAVRGKSLPDNRAYAEKLQAELAKLPALRDLQIAQSLDYPTVEVNVDRERAGLAGVTPQDVANSLVAATSSTRFTQPLFWADPKSGIGYQVQVEIPRSVIRETGENGGMDSVAELGEVPIGAHQTHASNGNGVPLRGNGGIIRVRDVADIKEGTMPGQFDRYNMMREVTLTANIAADVDLGTVTREVARALERTGEPPKGVQREIRGQLPPMEQILNGLSIGLLISIVCIFLLLAANFQSLKLALAATSTAPAALSGIVLLLWVTGTTLNIQSFIGAIMAVGVVMSNAILLITFAERLRREGIPTRDAAITGAESRLRAVLMTSSTMIAGMLPMALAWGEAGAQNAPLGRAVVGGLALGTCATFFVLPSVFAILQARTSTASCSLDPEDPESPFFDKQADSQLQTT